MEGQARAAGKGLPHQRRTPHCRESHIAVRQEAERLDLRGLKCPMPALLAKRRLRAVPGALLEIRTDDPMAPVDIPHMCDADGHELISLIREGVEAVMVLRARGAR